MNKKCNTCNLIKDIELFSKRGHDKFRGQCKVCFKIPRNTPTRKYKRVKRDSFKRGHDFTLSFDEFKQFEGKPCRYCGEELSVISLDRIDNSKGYILENVDSCCKVCNKLKHILSEDEFINKIIDIYKYQLKEGFADE